MLPKDVQREAHTCPPAVSQCVPSRVAPELADGFLFIRLGRPEESERVCDGCLVHRSQAGEPGQMQGDSIALACGDIRLVTAPPRRDAAPPRRLAATPRQTRGATAADLATRQRDRGGGAASTSWCHATPRATTSRSTAASQATPPRRARRPRGDAAASGPKWGLMTFEGTPAQRAVASASWANALTRRRSRQRTRLTVARTANLLLISPNMTCAEKRKSAGRAGPVAAGVA